MASGLENEYVTLHEIVKAAKIRLNANIWDYLIGGTETETTLRRNRMELDSIAFKPRVLRDVSKIDPSSEIFGKKLRIPVLLAPVGSLESFEPGGGITVAKGAGAGGVGMLISSVTTLRLEDIVKGGAGPKIYQLYVRGDDKWVAERVKQAMDAGYDAFCITVDTQVYSRRERDIAKRFAKPWRAAVSGMEQVYQAAYSWKNVEHFKKKYKIPLVLKGIGTAEDAKMAVEHGVDMIYVSNHGGRQLDHGRGSFDVLAEVLEVVNKKAVVIVDGGFNRGTDIVKAMAMGADIVGVGRLYCYALAAAGQAGIVRLLTILEDEVRSAMGLTGVTSYDQLNSSFLYKGAPMVAEPRVHSVFPLLNLDDPGYGGR